MNNFGLYIVITKPILDYHVFVQACVDENVLMVQLREKHHSTRDLLKLSKKLKNITAGSNTNFILNDFPNVAALAQADGVHLGPEDVSLGDALDVYNKEKIFGVSTHSYSDAVNVINRYKNGTWGLKPDYMSFGPIYATPTKDIPDEPVGLDLLACVINLSPIPVVAIGGIFPENIQNVLSCGAKNIAMVRYFTQAKEITELKDRIRTIQSIIKENQK